MDREQKPMKRKRGGQPGNRNALKHGFYSKGYAIGEIDDLDAMLKEGLEDEIVMLRVMTRRLVELADGNKSIESAIANLNTLGAAATRLGGLLKTQKILYGDDSSVSSALSEAISEVMDELRNS